MALSKYLNDTGAMKTIRAKMASGAKKKSSAKPADFTPSLTQQLKFVANSETVPIPSEARRAIVSFISEGKSPLTLERMHAFTHNRYVPPTADQLRGFWENLHPLLIVILQNEEGANGE